MTQPEDIAAAAKAQVSELGRSAKAAAAEKVAQDGARIRNHAADEVNQAAQAAFSAAGAFDPGTVQAQAARQIAQSLESLAHQVRTTDLADTVDRVSGFARRNPAVFIGAAALAGFAATRFLKARDPSPTTGPSNIDDPWAAASGHQGHTTVLAKLNGERRDGTA